MNISDMIEEFMERCFDTVAEVFLNPNRNIKNNITKDEVIKVFKTICEEWETYEIDPADWCTGYKLIYQYLGEIMIREYYDINFVGSLIKQLGKLLYNNRNCETMKRSFVLWKQKQINKDFE